MAKKRLTDLQLLADIANSDVIHLVDVSDTSQNSAGSSRKVTMSTIKSYVTSGLTISWDNVSGKPSTFAPSAHTHPIEDIEATGTPSASTYLRGDGTWAVVSGGGGTWGTITGTLSNQTDLQTALNAKANLSGAIFTGNISALNLSGTNTGDQDLSNYLEVGDNISDLTNDAGYITSYTETDPVFSAWLDTDPLDGFITSESDPVYSASSWFSTTNNSSNWDTAFGWGNHADAGYVTSGALSDYALLDGSNQPFTGDIDISKSAPRHTLINTGASNAETYIEKLTSGDETRWVSQNRPFISGGGITCTIANNGGTFSHTLSNWSISFWIKTTDTAQNMFAGNTANNTTCLIYHESGLFNVRLSGSTVSWSYPSATLANNTWQHIVFAVAKNGSSQVYVNGVSLGNVTAPNADAVLTHILRGGTGSLARGTFDEYIVFDSQINQAKVDELYQAGAPVKFTNYTGVYAAFHLDTGSGSTYFDSSGNGRNAVATTAPTWTTGVVATTIEALEDIELVTIANNGVHLSYGTLTFGYYNSTKSTSNIYEGLTHSFRTLNTEYMGLSPTALAINVPTTITGTLTATGNVTTSGVFYAGTGSATFPSLSFTSDSNTGIYRSAIDTLGFATGGTFRGSINSAGTLTMGAGTVSAIPQNTSSTFVPGIGAFTTSGSAGISAGVTDGTNNRRAGLFVNQTDAIWGLSHSYSSGRAPFVIVSNTTEQFRIDTSHRVGIGEASPTAWLHLKAGIATAGFAPLKFNSGTNLTTAENGAMEYNGTNLFFTRTGAVREGVLTQSAVTTEVVISDTTVTVNIGGTNYKLLARA